MSAIITTAPIAPMTNHILKPVADAGARAGAGVGVCAGVGVGAGAGAGLGAGHAAGVDILTVFEGAEWPTPWTASTW